MNLNSDSVGAKVGVKYYFKVIFYHRVSSLQASVLVNRMKFYLFIVAIAICLIQCDWLTMLGHPRVGAIETNLDWLFLASCRNSAAQQACLP